MAVSLLSVPIKESFEIDITPLKNLIADNYNTNDGLTDVTVTTNEFNQLRNKVIKKPLEKHDSALELLYWYHDQICSLEKILPVKDVDIGIKFRWQDAFDKGSIFVNRLNLAMSSLLYEKCCILFNIAALQSCVAASQSVETDEGRKKAIKLLQQSSGTFSHLATFVISQPDMTPDLNPETLNALAALMLAQAQEIFVYKAIQDCMKEGTIAKLASQCEELYTEALKQLQKEALKSLWDKEWLPTVSGKQSAYHGLAHFYQSLVCKSNKNIGEEISRLEHALESFTIAQQRSYKQMFPDLVARAENALSESKKDNNFIYHERIPDINTLSPISKASLAKPLQVSEKLSITFKDLFGALHPLPIQKALTAHNKRREELVSSELAKLNEANQKLDTFVTGLGISSNFDNIDSTSISVQQLNTLMQKVQILREERRTIERELKVATTDILPSIQQALNWDGTIDEAKISSETLGRIYGALQQRVHNSLQQQTPLEVEITRAHAQYTKENMQAKDKCVIS